MNKIILFFILGAIFFAACKNGEKHIDQTPGLADTDTLTHEELKKYPEIAKEDVKKMVDYYKTLPHDINTNIVRMISMDGSLLRKLLKKRDRVRFITAAYLTDNDHGKKGDVTIIIRLLSRNPGVVYYDFNTIFGKQGMQNEGHGICPPPPDCEPTSDSEDSFSN